ncbi:3-dehydroquinate dehydratase [Caloramator quimbayensis]|uniref:3-dehydroquinate dehydratase n=1 Tax=Caloramator quimbayensis TaxID=1147123 RepID=A0A1T4Y048_9CLOT|nr:type I 3-dehydroquinate dehydratase [Caloramator quimbayensis]SKA94993.1 3-dehydroquinate dehydratase [Caloramator quimbayensis]
MSKTLKIRDIIIGEGIPKICTSLVDSTIDDLIEESYNLKKYDLDLVEWRADFYEDIYEIEKVEKALISIRKIIYDKPLIFTFRSGKEGGAKNIDESYYFELIDLILKTKLADIVDIELLRCEEKVKDTIDKACKNGIAVILSYHNIYNTPSRDEILNYINKADNLGADIIKVSVMAKSTKDVITLLESACAAKENIQKPFIAISMGKKGIISRISGEIFGSCITFGSVKNKSALGQIHVEDLKAIISIIHKNL